MTAAQIQPQASPSNPHATEAKSASGQGCALGCLGGSMFGSGLILIGGLLCLTGIGAIIGVPLILAGLVSPFLGSLLSAGALKGTCPWCGDKVTSQFRVGGLDCPTCKKRIVIRDKAFIKIE